MSAWLSQVRLALRAAASGLRASLATSAVAAVTIAVTLVLVGAFGLLVVNMERLLDRFGEDLRVSAFLVEGLDADAQEALRARATEAPGVLSVELVTEEQALDRFRRSRVSRAALLEGLEDNPLPASLEIALVPERRSREGLALLIQALEAIPGIAELGYGHEWVEGYARALSLVRGLATLLGAVLIVASLLIVTGTIRLAVYARREEIQILELVGAGYAFVVAPFLIEGLVQGMAGGTLALGVLFGLYQVLVPTLRGSIEVLLGDVQPAFFDLAGSLWIVLGGAALGMLGSAAALIRGPDR
ncbi:MAG: permease-like cell division protein FtsX [Myxococcota bacterium]|nr:permease-like cell division protein FtsX [Myxococcota bacterium]